jgi:rubredoxin-NAD+ reductase
MAHPIIIIGAGLAGWTAAREFRKLDATTPLTVVTADSGDFYAKPSLSNAFAQRRAPAQLVSTPAAKMADTLNVTLLAHTQVQAISPTERTVTTSQGALQYSQLVLATGANPIRIPMEGDAAGQVMSINSLDDFSGFHALLTSSSSSEKESDLTGVDEAAAAELGKKKHIFVMGAGLIGCEFANDLVTSHYQVSVADPSSSPMSALLPAQASQQLQDALADLGVVWHFGTTVVAVNHAVNVDAQAAPALEIVLSSGQIAKADIVLSAIGLRANTALAHAAGLMCERGILVDDTLQTSAQHIFALGDGAQYARGQWASGAALTGGRSMPYVMPIMSAAKALAATLAGAPTAVVFPLMPVAIKTPAFPIVVAAPAPGTAGEWQSNEAGVWQFMGQASQVLGFVLTGKNTSRRAEQAKLVNL